MKYEILLFDADNTVLDFDKSEEQALARAFCENGLKFSNEILLSYRRNNIRQWEMYEKGLKTKEEVLTDRFIDTFRELKISADINNISKLYESYLKDGFFVTEHAEETLNALQGKHRLYVVTNGVLEIQNSRMKGSGMEKYFIKRFVSEEIGHPKPKKEYFDCCFEQIENFDKSKTLIIGDSLTSDIQGGINADIDTCWFNPKGYKNNTEFNPTYEIADLSELLKIV